MSDYVTPGDQESVAPAGVTFTHGDIKAVVDDFYHHVQQDPALSVPFQSVHDWPEHIKRLTHFWWIRFGGTPYMAAMYNPVEKHFFAGFNRALLAQWLFLFHETLRRHLNEAQVEFWKAISERMGESLSLRNEALQKQSPRSDDV